MKSKSKKRLSYLKHRLYVIIFKSDTFSGKFFDILLLLFILLSIIVVLLDSVERFYAQYHQIFQTMEWIFTIIFTIEYFIRLFCAKKRLKYIISFFGIIDLIAVLPSYINLFNIFAPSLIFIRVLRLLRIFRILKMGRYIGQANYLLNALKHSFRKIIIFLVTVMTIVIIIGSLMHSIEGPKNGFVSIPKSIYWAIVTLTTVGYGDITPQSDEGQILSAIIMLLGYGISAVPTGIISAELALSIKKQRRICPHCKKNLYYRAKYCAFCGKEL